MRWAGLAVLVGCAPSSAFELAIPGDVEYVGAARADGIADDPRDDAAAAPADDLAGLVRPVDGAVLLRTERDRPWVMFGYRAADLATFAVPSEIALAATPVEPVAPSACWKLPPPSWSAPLDSGAGAVPPLFAGWAVQCPDPAVGRYYDVRCPGEMGAACGASAAREDGCLDVLGAEACAEVQTEIAIESDGRACPLEAARPASCAAITRDDDGGERWRCDSGCVFDFYANTPPMPLEISAVTVGVRAPGPDNYLEPTNVRWAAALAGSTTALGVRGDVAVAATRSDVDITRGLCSTFDVSIVHSLHVIDADTMAMGPPLRIDRRCVTRIVPDPVTGGFLLGYHDGEALGLARLDAQGTWRDERRIARELLPSSFYNLAVSAILTSSSAVVVIESEGLDEGAGETIVHVLDPVTLEPSRPTRRTAGTPQGAAWLDEDQFVLARYSVGRLDVAGLTGDIPTLLLNLPVRQMNPVALGNQRVLASDTSSTKGVIDLEVSRGVAEIRRTAPLFEKSGIPLEVLLIAPDRAIVSVAVAADLDRRWLGGLAMLEISADDVRILPGMITLALEDGEGADGPLVHLQRDDEGRIWAMQPWLGRVLRVTLP